ncbi:pentatricopeptide repeat-containing protein, mitochondrial-like [Cocos nucifera]|uniref:Pentatricopeptide repeat-containing protein, mitochondrial-like n=1 Tax=Cocos nucifera TaxID=13894 RepID=A0A8K0IKT2_COCNU|nr:pentatricopeptide repeat-containing protein, mitochondrial-like [Cocos nucifera]
MAHLKQTHARIIVTGLSLQHDQTSPKILHLCSLATPPDPNYAHLLFHRIQSPDALSWNCLLRAQARSQDPIRILSLYNELLKSGAKPNGITFSFVIKSCSNLKKVRFLMGIHAQLLALGFQSDTLVLNSLIHGYIAGGSLNSACVVFDELSERDLISWTELIKGYVRNGRAKEAVELFLLMMEANVRPDEITAVAVFTACAQLGDLNLGRKVESLAFKCGIRYNTYVVNSLIDMYGKCGSIGDAWKLFDGMVNKDVVSWNSMVAGYSRCGNMEAARRLFDRIPKKNEVSWSLLINGYVQNGGFKEALMVYREMSDSGIAPNEAAITGTIAACSHLGSLDFGREIHVSLDKSKLQSDVILSTALVDMYAKCGCLGMACELFDGIVKKNLVSWNVMIMGLAIHGKASECLELFSEMLKDGLIPNSLTFVGVLSACAHAGWLEKGKEYFDKMTRVYGIAVRAEHCSCMVHLMGQAGLLTEAFEFIRDSPIEHDVATWGALLSACRFHGYVELGKFVGERILELDPSHRGAYVQLSSVYAAAGRWREVLEIRKKMKDIGIKNRPGWSYFDLNGTIHEFLVGVNSHPRIKDIHSVLHTIDLQMRSQCYAQTAR